MICHRSYHRTFVYSYMINIYLILFKYLVVKVNLFISVTRYWLKIVQLLLTIIIKFNNTSKTVILKLIYHDYNKDFTNQCSK